ncbi:MAG: methionine/alanine import family NSS transporter small subunit [Propionibacteriaceae bacterium]|nr:methionine/alanine import family NSS transporter small subunit [Propionibacteriaceae bacterium]
MSPTAIIMMVVAILTLWGGLVAAVVNLARRPDQSAVDEAHHGA